MPGASDLVRLRHMLEAARKAVGYVQGRARADLDGDELLSLALTRLLEVLGEAGRAVSEEVKDQHPAVPWREVAATRNRLIHGCFDVDLDIVWSIVSRDLPPVVAELERILAAEPE